MYLTLTFQDPLSAAQFIIDHCKESTLFCFTGDLGAGKTTTIQAMCKLLGYQGEVTSPTYAIVNEYTIDHRSIYHMDLYRLKDMEEAIDIGIEDYLFDGNGICLVEWPALIQQYVDLPRYDISIQKVAENVDSRQLTIELVGNN